jgi:uncharacterized membrane protein YkoI
MRTKGKYLKNQNRKGKSLIRRRKGKTSQRLTGIFAIGLIVMSILSFLYIMPKDNLVSQIGTAEPYIELDPETTQTNITQNDAIDIFLNNSTVKGLWREPTPYWYDPFDTDVGANVTPESDIHIRLIQDNVRSYIRWEVLNNTVTIWIDAETGEIIHYSNYDFVEGSVTESEALNLSLQYINNFTEIPPDANLYNISKRSQMRNVILDINGTIKEIITDEVFVIIFSRMKNSVPSDDGIEVWMSTSGQLVRYEKTWTLIMPGSTIPQISEEDAISIAKNTFNGTVNQITLMIKRPNYYWTQGEYLYGFNEGILSFVVDLTNSSSRHASVWVDAVDGDVIGGWQTL